METEFISAADSPPTEEALDRLAGYLRDGELVALPTETVYGIGARCDRPEALEKLRALKGRKAEHVFTVHLADRESVASFLPPAKGRGASILPLAERLMRRYWPGPLTLVLPDAQGKTTGFRVPAKEMTREILRRVGAPVALTSANPTGTAPAADAASVQKYFPQGLRALLDGGPCPLAESSTVLQLDAKGPKILREGIITLADARRAMGKSVLFLCTGNTCRSPLAEGILKKRLAERWEIPIPKLGDFGFRVASAGLASGGGSPASALSLKAAKEIGVDLSSHRSRGADLDLLRQADLVLVMGQSHLDRVREIAPEIGDRARLLDPAGESIPDPFGGSIEEYRACREAIARGIERIIPEL